jgi:deoxycytidine triphosphate deaminase
VYLADRDIRALLPELGIEGPDPDRPFSPDQIQPCSIDLRISNVFWKPSRRRRLSRRLLLWRRAYVVDLRRSGAHDLDPLRDWKRLQLAEGDALTIKPKEVLMARVYERFRVPPGYAGKIEGRSSFARLGLAVHCTGDFINPGWHGYMPLQLFNAGPYPIRVTPYLDICQLMLIPLTALSQRNYGDPDLQSKYVNDDGGPSLWWRDRRVRELQRRLGERHATERMKREVIDLVRFTDVDLFERFEDFVAKQKIGDIDYGAQLLERFAEKEDRRRLIDSLALGSNLVLLPALIGSLFLPFSLLTALLGLLTLLGVLGGLRGYFRRDGGYLGRKELRAADHVRRPDQDGDRGAG